MKELLSECNIQYYIADFTKDKWIKHSGIKKIEIETKERDLLFGKCGGRDCPVVINNKFYLCEYAANADRLEAIPYNEDNYILLKEENLKNRLINYMSRNNSLPACSYCTRLLEKKRNENLVEPGIQIDRPLSYERIKRE